MCEKICELTIKIPNSKKVKCSINSIIEENSNNNFIEISLCETNGKNERNEKEEKINKEKKNEKNDIFSYVENKIIKQKNRLENTIKNKKVMNKGHEYQIHYNIYGMMLMIEELELLEKNQIEKLENLNKNNFATIVGYPC